MPSPAPKDKTAKTSIQTDHELIHSFLRRMSFDERWQPVAQELQWVVGGCKNVPEHKKILTDYCYEILHVWRKTVFKNFPSLENMVSVAGVGKSAKAKIDWRNMGKAISIGERGMRFFDLEAIPLLKSDGLLNLNPAKEQKVLKLLYGDKWLKQKLLKVVLRPHQFFKRFVDICRNLYFKLKILGFSKWAHLAYRTGPEAVSEFKAGMAEGQVGFLNDNGQLVGESNRSNNYQFMLLAWPEIKEMLERKPLPTRTDVFDWTKPYTKAGLCSFIDIDQFRDFCEDIKLKFAGRSPKKAPMPSA